MPFTAEDAWRKLMYRIGVSNIKNVHKGTTMLNGVDKITGLKSKVRAD